MRPKRRRTGHAQPDLIAEEISESLGGTDGETMGEDEDWGRPLAGEMPRPPKEQELELEEARS
jgi:hypothetical protein